jgi:hypothetical protein
LREEVVHDIACVFKMYLRELPEPLLPERIFPTLTQAMAKSEREEMREGVQQAMQLLSPQQAAVVSRLFRHLRLVHDMAHTNHMAAANLVVCFVPSLTALLSAARPEGYASSFSEQHM